MEYIRTQDTGQSAYPSQYNACLWIRGGTESARGNPDAQREDTKSVHAGGNQTPIP